MKQNVTGPHVDRQQDDTIASSTAVLEVDRLAVTYGTGPDAVEALRDISCAIFPGEFACVVGPSGCGKTTMLKSIAGLMRPTSGTTAVEGRPVDGPPEGLALVFQEYARSLLPWLTVRQNVELPLKVRREEKAERNQRTLDSLRAVGLAGFEDKYPWQLSGGMQQRAAIARAIAYRPTVLLMDEPFASVDAQTRADLEDLLLRVQHETGVTIVFVTHDIDEAVYLGHRVIVLSGRPTIVREELDVPFGDTRDQVETRSDPRFIDLRTHIMRQIQSERVLTTAGPVERD